MRGKNAPAAVILLICLLPASLSAQATAGQLSHHYRGKQFTLRHFYTGDHLRFSSDGILDGQAPLGPWTTAAKLTVTNISLQGRTLQITGRRQFLFFDSDKNEFRDLSTIHPPDPRLKSLVSASDFLKQLANRQRVAIEIELASETPDLQEVSMAMNSIFLRPDESLASIAPSFWQDWFALQQGISAADPAQVGEPIYQANSPGIKNPHPTNIMDPEYSEQARQAGYTGTVIFSVVVDSSGMPREIQIVKPAGLGLDEKSMEAVNTWRFQPGQKNANPVAVRLEVQTSFRLYSPKERLSSVTNNVK